MATMNISLPDKMKEWVEARSADGSYANVSDFMRDMIRREQLKAEKIAELRRLVDEGRNSGSTTIERSAFLAELKTRARAEHGNPTKRKSQS